ncbi:MAG: EpsI family protein [Betaproteobacteria bacterium]|nr:EpsI family protein [Betaproteobacteria bacterium]NBT11019.1 EpsI family protein [Betaproteobacteria bacterium]
MRRRAAIAAGGSMLAIAGLSEWATPRRMMAIESPLPSLGSLLPLKIGPWLGEEASRHQLVAADVQAVLDHLYQQTLSRFYRHPQAGVVMLSAAYGGDQSDATRVHRPEVCYPAQGFVMGPLHRDGLTLGRYPHRQVLPVSRVTARLGIRVEPITYWITVGRRVATRSLEQKMIQIQYGLTGVVPDGLLMRVSSLNADAAQAWWTHQRFIDALFMAVDTPYRARVFGDPDLDALT